MAACWLQLSGALLSGALVQLVWTFFTQPLNLPFSLHSIFTDWHGYVNAWFVQKAPNTASHCNTAQASCRWLKTIG
jgi:hypothetical protein